MSKSSISKQKFDEIKADLKKELADELEEEVSFDDFDSEDSGLWETPAVDSKAVVNLSPTVEKHTGSKLDPAWIKCGGYDSVSEAVNSELELAIAKFKSKSGKH